MAAPERYSPDEDGHQFRLVTFRWLTTKYQPVILDSLEILNDLSFEFPLIAKAHTEQLRPGLIFRHSLPFCITESSYFKPTRSSSRVLAALLAGHTLALTNLDYHLDGAPPNPSAAATAYKTDAATAAVYSAHMIYAAGQIIGELGEADWLFRDVLGPVSGFVVGRMHQDWVERYCESQLKEVSERLCQYLNSPTSRLLGSGYWEVMVRGSFASRSSAPPQGLIEVIRQLRKLRQTVDEIADFEEDLTAGLVTSPLLFALQDRQYNRPLVRAVRALWDSRRAIVKDDLGSMLTDIRSMTIAAGGFDQAIRFAHDIWSNSVEICKLKLGRHAMGYVVLLDLKRAKLSNVQREINAIGSSNRLFMVS